MLPGFGVPPEAHWEAQVDCKQFIWGVNPGNTGGEKGNDTGKGGQQTEGVNKQLLQGDLRSNPTGLHCRDCGHGHLRCRTQVERDLQIDPLVPICHRLRAAPRLTSDLFLVWIRRNPQAEGRR